VLTEIKNRGVNDVCIAVCDGLKGLPESITTTWQYTPGAGVHPAPDPQHHPLRLPQGLGRPRQGSAPGLHRAKRRDAAVRFDEFADKRGDHYPAIIRLLRNVWSEFIPFRDYDVEIRTIICSTNAIESLNARYRRAVRARGHFPTEQAALKCLNLVTRSLDPTGRGRARWAMRWKPALNAFAITFESRIVPSTTS
jgi:putative transposase